jgi:hypothetical protein
VFLVDQSTRTTLGASSSHGPRTVPPRSAVTIERFASGAQPSGRFAPTRAGSGFGQADMVGAGCSSGTVGTADTTASLIWPTPTRETSRSTARCLVIFIPPPRVSSTPRAKDAGARNGLIDRRDRRLI